jgi:putative hydrolase of the HAD superfamily
MTVRGVFFDLDDTLHDHLYPFSKAIKATFPLIAEQVHIESLYKKFRECSDLLWRDYTVNELTLEELRIQRIVLALREFDIYIENEEAYDFQSHYQSCLTNLQLFSEVPELLQTFKSMGLQIGIITNGPIKHQYSKITSLGLIKYIPRNLIFISDEVGVAKPNPEIFHHVAQKINIRPSELIYIGDSWINDVVAPAKAGWHSIWYNHRNRKQDTDYQPLAVIDHLPLLLNIISEMKSRGE